MKHHLKIGHVGLFDAMPLLIAQEKGFFASEDLEVTLSCELGLATLCGKLADRRIDGASLPAPLPVLLSLGAGVPRVTMKVILICCWQGMGIVIAGSRSHTRPSETPMRIGVIAPDTSTRLLLHWYAQSANTALPTDVTPVPMAASQLVDFMREGMLDGFCGIDPLPALARILVGAESVADSATFFAMHPGGVVALRTECAEHASLASAALERALLRARDYCADPGHLDEMGRILMDQVPYASLDPVTRTSAIAALSRPGWMSMRFNAPLERAGISSAPEVFVERACRGITGTGPRALELKAEIARVFARRAASASTQTVTT